MILQEAVVCTDCSHESHAHNYTQSFFNVTAPSLAAVHTVLGSEHLGELLQTIEGQTQKSCDKDDGKPHQLVRRVVRLRLFECLRRCTIVAASHADADLEESSRPGRIQAKHHACAVYLPKLNAAVSECLMVVTPHAGLPAMK